MATLTLVDVPKKIIDFFGKETTFSTFFNAKWDGMDMCTPNGEIIPTQQDKTKTYEAMRDLEMGDNTVIYRPKRKNG